MEVAPSARNGTTPSRTAEAGPHYFTPHFSLEELTRTSQRGPDGEPLANVPSVGEVNELRHLCAAILEPIRELWGCPVRVTSGYRSFAVERAIKHLGPSDPLRVSQHNKGQAVDIQPRGLGFAEAFEAVAEADHIPWDQLIFEHVGGATWIHVSCAPTHRVPRRQALYTTDGKTYAPYHPGMARALVGAA